MTTQLFKNTLHGIAELSPGITLEFFKLNFILCSAFNLTYSCGYSVDTKYLSVCVYLSFVNYACSGGICATMWECVCECESHKTRALEKVFLRISRRKGGTTLRHYFSTN